MTARFRLTFAIAAACGAPALAQDAACAEGMRSFSHPLVVNSPVCVPVAPERPAFIDANIADALALDIPSVTTSYYGGVAITDFPGLAGHLGPDTVDVGNTWEMAGEPLLIADPDLVISSIYWEDANRIAQDVAPTIIIDADSAQGWRDTAWVIAELFGKQAEQTALDTAVDARIAAFRAALEEQAPGATFTFVQVEAAGQYWLFTDMTFGVQIAESAGLTLPDTALTPDEAAAIEGGGSYAAPVSAENLDMIAADHIFLYANTGADVAGMLAADPMWARFAASRPDGVHLVPGEYWFNPSAYAAHRVIDDLWQWVLDTDPDTVSPNPLAWTYRVE